MAKVYGYLTFIYAMEQGAVEVHFGGFTQHWQANALKPEQPRDFPPGHLTNC